jgi:hypothetical protein
VAWKSEEEKKKASVRRRRRTADQGLAFLGR